MIAHVCLILRPDFVSIGRTSMGFYDIWQEGPIGTTSITCPRNTGSPVPALPGTITWPRPTVTSCSRGSGASSSSAMAGTQSASSSRRRRDGQAQLLFRGRFGVTADMSRGVRCSTGTRPASGRCCVTRSTVPRARTCLMTLFEPNAPVGLAGPSARRVSALVRRPPAAGPHRQDSAWHR